MKTRFRVLCGLLLVLWLAYLFLFTEWFRPAPIEIASQVRFTVQPPHFGVARTKVQPGQTNHVVPKEKVDGVGAQKSGAIDQAPGGAANVTFSLDGWYRLTALRVQDVPADGSAPQILWQLVGKSQPVNSLLYNRVPEGMKPILEGTPAEPLKPGVPYSLIVEAGRRRGTNSFRTVEVRATE